MHRQPTTYKTFSLRAIFENFGSQTEQSMLGQSHNVTFIDNGLSVNGLIDEVMKFFDAMSKQLSTSSFTKVESRYTTPTILPHLSSVHHPLLSTKMFTNRYSSLKSPTYMLHKYPSSTNRRITTPLHFDSPWKTTTDVKKKLSNFIDYGQLLPNLTFSRSMSVLNPMMHFGNAKYKNR